MQYKAGISQRSQLHPQGQEELSDEFVRSIDEALSDLKKVTIKVPDLKNALLAGGSPFNPGEMKSRLDTYLSQLTAGKDPSKVRIVLE